MSRRSRRRLHLALQGGGAHGAFTWGVLDRLLDDPRLEIAAISGTSAGALNGAALATGFARAGSSGAKEHLARLWRQAFEAGLPLALFNAPLKKPAFGVWDDAMPLVSPYHTSPFGLSNLRYVLSSVVDEELLRSGAAPALYVNAVHVQSGASRVFGPADISVEALMASACAPLMFPAVVIDGEAYWDGSYAANPVLRPLYEGASDVDILLVELMPARRALVPTAAKNILNRINEIASLHGLVSELQALAAANARSSAGQTRLHLVSLPEALPESDLDPSIKRSVDFLLFESLRQKGHAACDQWLAAHFDDIGQRPSMDMHTRYLLPPSELAACD